MAATAKSMAATAKSRAATAKVSPSAATAPMAATAAATAASAPMAATAATATTVLRISQRRNGRDRHRDQQAPDRLQEISGRHLGSRFDHSSSPHFTRARFEGREAIH